MSMEEGEKVGKTSVLPLIVLYFPKALFSMRPQVHFALSTPLLGFGNLFSFCKLLLKIVVWNQRKGISAG